MPGFVGIPELLLLGLVALLVFGPKRLPEMGRSLGKGLREFKDSITSNDGGDKSDSFDLDALAATDAESTRATQQPAVSTTEQAAPSTVAESANGDRPAATRV